MSESKEIIFNLRNKFQTIVSINERYREKNQLLLKEMDKLNSRIAEQDLKIDNLNEKIESIGLAEAFSVSGEDNQEARLRMNKIVREIDKCIALLNR